MSIMSCAHKSIVDERTNRRVTARLYRTCVLTQVRQKPNYHTIGIMYILHDEALFFQLKSFLILHKNMLWVLIRSASVKHF